jgi:hypothetical protein
MAIAKQDAGSAPKQQEEDVFKKAVEYIKGAKDSSQAFDAVLTKYGSQFTDKQKEALRKFVK